MQLQRCLLACTTLATLLLCGCGQQLQTVFFEDFDNAPLNQPPPATPQKGVEITLDDPDLARVHSFGGQINSRAVRYDQPTGLFQSIYFVASTPSANYDDGFRVIWRGKYGKVNDAGVSLSLMSGHFNTAWTVIFKGGKVKVFENNQEVEIGLLPLDHAHTFMCTALKSTGKYSLSIIGDDGTTLSKEGPIQMSAFWNSSPVSLRLYSLDGKPNPQSQGDSFIIDEPNIVAIKKGN
ncbi:MAG TPA: hypothetical protein VNL69_00480 [Bacteroidota bacterium]|nr:hypothetical protein [Bacteroidota bacterium]